MKDFSVNSSIIISTKHSTQSFRIPLLILLAVAGCISMLDVCITMIAPEFNRPVFWCISVLTVLFTCFLSILPKYIHFTGYIPLLAGICYTAFNFYEVSIGAKLFCNAYYSAAYKTETDFFELIPHVDEKSIVTLFMCCASVVLCSLISRLVVRKPLFLIYFALTFIPVELGLYHGMEMRLLSMMVLIITWFGVLGVQLSVQKGHTSGVRGVRTSNTANCGIAASLITAAAVALSFSLSGFFGLTSEKEVQDKRREVRKEIEDFNWNDIAGSLTDLGVSIGLMDDPDERELGTKNSLEYKNKDDLRITLSELPEQGFYLKNYTGSVYDDNMWRAFSDKEWKSNERLNTLFTRFECVPQILPFMNNQGLYEFSRNAEITIEPLERSATVLQPYASYNENCSYVYDSGCVVNDKDRYSFTFSLMQDFSGVSKLHLNEYYLPSSGFNFSDSVTASFFSQLGVSTEQEMFNISVIVPPYLDNSEYTTQTLQAVLTENYVYRDFVHDSYTYLEDEESLEEVFLSLPAELIHTGNSGDTIEILSSIRSYLDEQCEYTLSPGRTPSTRDFVNYFLLENNAGYCMHYATAGTVLARHFGIPARYCEGYIISSDMMQNGTEHKDGSVTITIPDSASHAWCEYYVDGYGWIPFEFTPGYYNNTAPEEPTYTETSVTTETSVSETTVQTETITETSTSVSSQQNTITTSTDESQNQISDNGNSVSGASFKTILIIFAVILACSLIIALIILIRQMSLKRRKKQFGNADKKYAVLSIYNYLIRILEIDNIRSGNMQMLDFADHVKKVLNEEGCDGSGAKEIILAALAADMGGKMTSDENVTAYEAYTTALAQKIIGKKPVYQQVIFKYLFHLI